MDPDDFCPDPGKKTINVKVEAKNNVPVYIFYTRLPFLFITIKCEEVGSFLLLF